MLTVRTLLARGGDLPLADAPYGKEVYFACLSSNIDLDINMSCDEVLAKLGTISGQGILNMSIDEFPTMTDNRLTHVIASWCFKITIIAVFLFTIDVIYISYIRQEFPDFSSMTLLVSIPAMVMWNKMSLLKADKARALKTLLKSVVDIRRGSPTPVEKSTEKKYTDLE